VWLALQQAGRAGYVQMISDDMALARRLYQLVQEHPRFEPITQSLSITTFRYVPPDLQGRAGAGEPDAEEYLNRLNQHLLARIEKSGEAFLSNAVVGGKFALRACIVNFRTSSVDIDALPGFIARLGGEVDKELR
jgi:aromatic-L-amino-acid/L-tryptophan decarboxylase